MPYVDDNHCNGCGDCADICPVEALIYAPDGWIDFGGGNVSFSPGYARIYEPMCFYCGECEQICPQEAIIMGEDPYGPGTGSGDGGDGGGGGGGGGDFESYKEWVAQAKGLLSSKSAGYFKTVLDAGGLTADIQSLNHAAIKGLVRATGGVIEGDVLQVSKALSRIAVVGAVYNGLTTLVAFTDGDISEQDWKELGMTMLGIGGFIPGPIGIVCTGVSVGLAVFSMN